MDQTKQVKMINEIRNSLSKSVYYPLEFNYKESDCDGIITKESVSYKHLIYVKNERNLYEIGLSFRDNSAPWITIEVVGKQIAVVYYSGEADIETIINNRTSFGIRDDLKRENAFEDVKGYVQIIESAYTNSK